MLAKQNTLYLNGTETQRLGQTQSDQVSSQLRYFCGYYQECQDNFGPQSTMRKLNMAMAHVDK